MNYFNILNGPTYSLLIKDFWARVGMYDKFAALVEVRNAIENDKSLKGKTRIETGLNEFKCTEIKYVVMGVDIAITKDNIAQVIGVENTGIVKHNSKDGTKFASEIKANLSENQKYFGKVKNLYLPFRLLFKIIISSLIPREGCSD
ncbi:uncharacterized protein LOC127131923 [Lathyrus oleraceus]|uniref:uncharacterized protein LOC127131923 n=1 Tax=Pisum sativum TaxID=3888 RepID=UPI0021CECF1C|nr:uncharacterized protein LOC127131923 [Pisum sativum]